MFVVLQFMQKHIADIAFPVISDQMNGQIDAGPKDSHNDRRLQKCGAADRNMPPDAHLASAGFIERPDLPVLKRQGRALQTIQADSGSDQESGHGQHSRSP